MLKMAMAHGPLDVISSVEKVRSWMASTSEVAQYDPQDDPEGESMLFELTRHTVFGENRLAAPHHKLFIPIPKEEDEISSSSFYRKFLPNHASEGSKLPGFQKSVHRRQSIALLRKHAFRWATISSKKFVMIRSDGCNMVPWTDVNEYFFPLCDDPSCEIVLLALKYSMGYPKNARHIHPCSQREQLRFGDLFKVVSFGTILVDIDCVMSNKGALWALVEDMHASCNPGLMSSKCSYRCPEKKAFPTRASGGSPVATLSLPGRANTPWDGVMDFQQDDQTVFIEDSTTDIVKVNTINELESPHETNIVKFLGEQAAKMWSTLAEGKAPGARPTKSWNDVTPIKETSKTTELSDLRQVDSSSSSGQIRNQRSLSACDKRSVEEAVRPEIGLRLRGFVKTSAPQTAGFQGPHVSGPVVALRVNQNKLLPVILPGEGKIRKTQDISKWLVPIYLAQNICLNAHVTGRLVGVYRDYIIGRTCKTPGCRGYARLCTKQEGRDLTRWLFYMSEKASLIPNWTIVTSRCLLMQWKDFLSILPSDMIQGFELDLSLSVLKMGRQNIHGPIDSNDDVSKTDIDRRKAVGQACLMVKKYDKPKVQEQSRCTVHTCAKHDCPLPIDYQAISKVEGYQIVPDIWCPSADWSTPSAGEDNLPLPELKINKEETAWNPDGLPPTETPSPREEFLIGKCKCLAKKLMAEPLHSGNSVNTETKLPCIVGYGYQFSEDNPPDVDAGVSGPKQDTPLPKTGINVRKSSPGTLRAGKPSPRQKPKQPIKGRKYTCKPKLHADDDLAVDGQRTGEYQAGLDKTKYPTETKPHSKIKMHKVKRKYTRRLSKTSSREKQHSTKGTQAKETSGTEGNAEDDVDPEDKIRRKALESIPKELINNQSYEKYVHRRNQADDTRSEHGNNKSIISRIAIQNNSQPSCSPAVGTFASSKEAKAVLQSTDIKSQSWPAIAAFPDNDPRTRPNSSVGLAPTIPEVESTYLNLDTYNSNSEIPESDDVPQQLDPKITRASNAKAAFSYKSPSLDYCKLENVENEAAGRKNRFEGLSLWEEEDEIRELQSNFQPSKVSSQPLKHCLKKSGKKLPAKTVSWHIPGIYPREQAMQSGAKDKGGKAAAEKPAQNSAEKTERTKTNVTPKSKPSKVSDNRPLKPEPGGDFKPRTTPSAANKKVTGDSDRQVSKTENANDIQIKADADKITSAKSAAQAVGSLAYKKCTPETQPSNSNQIDHPKGVINLNEQSETPSTSGLAGKIPVKTCIKTDQHIFVPANTAESLARIYTGSNVQQQELIAKRLSLGRKAAKSEPKLPLEKPRSSSKLNSSGHSTSKGKRLVRKPKRKRETPKPKSELESGSGVTTFTAWAVKNEPGVLIDLDHHGDQKLWHTEHHLDDEPTFRIPVDRTELVKTCSIVQQQQKLLEAIQKKSKSKAKNKDGDCGEIQTPDTKESSNTEALCQNKTENQPSVIPAQPSCSLNSSCSGAFSSASVTSNKDQNVDQRAQYSFQPHFDPGQTVSNRGLAIYKDLVLPYVAMNGYKYVTLLDATRVFSLCQPSCRVARAMLRSHRSLHRTMCSWEQVYSFELTQPNKKPPVRTGDMLLRFDTLMLRLPLLELDIVTKHVMSRSKGSQKCGYHPPK